MLDQPVEPETTKPPAAGSSEGEDSYYVPPGKPEPLNGKGKVPSVKRFNRKMLFGLGAVGAVVVTLAFTVGLQSPKKQAAPSGNGTNAPVPTPNEAVNGLPGSYADVPILGDPKPGDVGIAMVGTGPKPVVGASGRQLNPLEQYQSQLELERLKRTETARSAGVAFANSSAATSGTSTAMADSSRALQDRILSLAQGQGASAAAPSVTSAAYREDSDLNGQEGKNQFADRVRGADFDLHQRVQSLKSPYTLLAGAILPCVLTQGINSDLPGQIGCLVSQNVYDSVTGKYLLVPQGTKAIGTYDSRVAYGQNRVLVVWTRLQRPDGSTLALEGMPGTDLSGYAGVTGHVNNHYLRLLSGVVLGSLVGASAQIAMGANSQNPSFAALAAQGAGQNINEAGQQITRKNLNVQPTIEVPPGARLNIFATKDLVLPPWEG